MRKRDDKLVEEIRLGGRHANRALKAIYQQFAIPLERKLMREQGARKEDAEDAVQEAVFILWTNIGNDEFRGEASLFTYLKSICVNHYRSRLAPKSVPPVHPPERKIPEEEDLETPEYLLLKGDLRLVIDGILRQVTPVCRRLFELFSLSNSMKEIARELGFKNDEVANTKKYKCSRRARQLFRDKGLGLDFFKELL